AANADGANVGSPLAGTYGTLTLNDDGSYTYDLNNGAVQFLGANETTTDSFTYTISDGHGGVSTANLVVTIHGTNDPIVAPAFSVDIVEDLITHAEGSLLTNVTDADVHDVHTITDVSANGGPAQDVATLPGGFIIGNFGILHIDTAGNASYDLDNANPTVQGLNTGSPALQDAFTFTITDSHGSTVSNTVTFNITGINDAPIAHPDSFTV